MLARRSRCIETQESFSHVCHKIDVKLQDALSFYDLGLKKYFTLQPI